LASGKDYPEEKTEVIYGVENINRSTLKRFSSTRVKVDSCVDPLSAPTTMNAKSIVDAIVDLKRGIKTRLITEITRDNLDACEEIMKITTEIRHLDEVKGNFSISDESIYEATMIGNFLIPDKVSSSVLSSKLEQNSQEAKLSTQSIYSTVKAFVGQQQYFFEMLWRRAIPAKLRIKEIEEGFKREFIETIRDPTDIQSLVSKIISSAVGEIDSVLSTSNSFIRYEKEGIIDTLKKRVNEDNLKVRILVEHNYEIQAIINELMKKYPQIAIRNLEKSIQTKVNTIVADDELSLVIELKDDSQQNSNEAIGLATYSNSESTVLSYASFFEARWIQSQILYR
jgi:two-component system, OmpR family, sensor histidine kinase VicK